MAALRKLLGTIGTWLDNIIVFGVLLSLGVAGSSVFLLGQGATQNLIDLTLQRQQVITKSGVNSIEAFFTSAGNTLVTLAANPTIVSGEADLQGRIDEFIDRWRDTPLVGIAVSNEVGTVEHVANWESQGQPGFSVGERKYFAWAKTAAADTFMVSGAVTSAGGGVKDKRLSRLPRHWLMGAVNSVG